MQTIVNSIFKLIFLFRDSFAYKIVFGNLLTFADFFTDATCQRCDMVVSNSEVMGFSLDDQISFVREVMYLYRVITEKTLAKYD